MNYQVCKRWRFFQSPLYKCFNHCVDGVQLNMLLFLHREFGKQHGFPIFSSYQLLPTHHNPVSQRQIYYFWHSNITAFKTYVEFVILQKSDIKSCFSKIKMVTHIILMKFHKHKKSKTKIWLKEYQFSRIIAVTN